jgi:hypothetical protein
LKIDPPEALGPKPRVLGCPKLLRRVTREKLGRPTKFHQKSRIRSKVIQQSLGDGRTDGRTDAIPPLPLYGRARIFICINFLPFHSLRSLTSFALFARGMIKNTAVLAGTKVGRKNRNSARLKSMLCHAVNLVEQGCQIFLGPKIPKRENYTK